MKARSRLFLFLLLALALLFAQQGAAVHALSHLSEPLPSQSRQDKQLPHSPACDKCVAYAGVGSAVAASQLAFSTFAPPPPGFSARPAARFQRPYQPYQTRAPPTIT